MDEEEEGEGEGEGVVIRKAKLTQKPSLFASLIARSSREQKAMKDRSKVRSKEREELSMCCTEF